jgi:MarR family transcriptional regulator, organic hydroperoxide resistance regulator
MRGKIPTKTAPSLARLDCLDPAITAEAEEIAAEIRALRRELFRHPSEEGAKAGVTGPQRSVIACLVARGPMTLTEISGTLGMGHSTASGIVDRLQARGFVRRAEDAADRRRTRISVTAKVTGYVNRLEAGPFGRLAQGLATASAEDRRAIRKGLRLLRELLREIPDGASNVIGADAERNP